jgi:hypothetical protein
VILSAAWQGGGNSTPRRKVAKTQSDFFYCETGKPRIIKKISWFPGFLMELFLVVPLRLCVKSFLPGGRLQRLAGRKNRGKRPTATARPGRGRIGQPFRNWGGRNHD